jgi:formate hydrogenlyase subunit 3/multisubunit Na+/H+ antiporter MnhD subunit
VSELVVLLLLVPLIGAVLSGLGRYTRGLPLAEIAAPGAVCASLALLVPLAPRALGGGPPLVYELGNWAEPVGIALYMDGLAWISSLIGMLVALCALLFAIAERSHGPRFYFFFLLLVFGMEGVVLTGDLFNLFVFLEILSIASYILIASRDRPQALLGSFRYLMISSLGMAFFLLGIFLFYEHTGTLSLKMMAEILRSAGTLPGGGVEGRLQLAVVCLAIGAGVKAGFVPFHTWLPDAHAAAPHPVSAVLSGVMIKISFLVVWRLLVLFAAGQLQQVLLWVGAVTAVFGVAAAIAQTDCKRLLAFSSVSQMGYIVAAFGAGSAAALGASLYHLVNHSLFKSLLFLSIGAVIHVTGERDIGRLRRLGGLAGRMPGVFALFLVGALSIAGLPPFNGYASKGLVAAGLHAWPVAYALILLAGAGTVASFLKLSGIFLTGPRFAVARTGAAPAPAGAPDAARGTGGGAAAGDGTPAVPPGEAATTSPRRVSVLMMLAMVILALLCVLTGVLPRAVGGAVSEVAHGAGGAIAAPHGRPAPVGAEAFSLYSLTHLLELGATVAVGIGFFFLATRTRVGERLLRRIRATRAGLNTALALVVLGFVVLAAINWLL